MNSKLNILMVPTELAGHVNAGIGLAITLRDRGHRVRYVVNSCHKNIVSDLGFDITTMYYNKEEEDNNDFETKYYKMIGWFYKNDLKTTISYLFNFRQNLRDIYLMMVRFIIKDRALDSLIKETNPDLIILDDLFCYPSIIKSRKPWVFFYSPNPVWFYQDHSLHFPSFPGIPVNY